MYSAVLLSRVILPLAQSYVLASYFNIRKKILRALIENIIVYLTLLVIFTIIFIYMLVKDIVTMWVVTLMVLCDMNFSCPVDDMH